MSLNASNFQYCDLYNKKQFEFVLEQIGKCCNMMVSKYKSLENDENILRNRLYKDFLNNNLVREELNLIPFIFLIESPEINSSYKETGRHDIRIVNSTESCHDTNLYYIIECKRLNGYNTGKGSLNQKYVHDGMRRFVKRTDYPSIYGKSGLIGFIVKNLNVNQLIDAINNILKKGSLDFTTSQFLTKTNEISSFKDSFSSVHQDVLNKDVFLYHLMFDLSSKIKKN